MARLADIKHALKLVGECSQLCDARVETSVEFRGLFVAAIVMVDIVTTMTNTGMVRMQPASILIDLGIVETLLMLLWQCTDRLLLL